MFTLVHLASGKLAHAYFKGKNSTNERTVINLPKSVNSA
jgi:hypothetical protein